MFYGDKLLSFITRANELLLKREEKIRFFISGKKRNIGASIIVIPVYYLKIRWISVVTIIEYAKLR